MMAHAPGCTCAVCLAGFPGAVRIVQSDRETLADVWERWRPADAGEIEAILNGRDGAPGSVRWIALQAVARTRVTAQSKGYQP